jgi:glutathione synthase/RimK-type ligase-like ATP-grasp enzyme
MDRRKLNYLRLNRDQFSEYSIVFDLNIGVLHISLETEKYQIRSEDLVSIYFRAPVFLRYSKQYSLEDQLYKSQWSSFIRNLCVFESAKWINNPIDTYRAENKLLQLRKAKECGFTIPLTFVANSLPQDIRQSAYYIIKSIDTALFYDNDQEMFTYSTKMTGKNLADSELKTAPVIIQECLTNKTDIRVTIIGKTIFAVSITNDGELIDGDWRRTPKELLRYNPIVLPDSIINSIDRIMSSLGLVFGGMDLARVDNKYYFIEVNPTGEWGWLKTNAKQPIDKAIVDNLTSTKNKK